MDAPSQTGQPPANPTPTTPSERVWEIDCFVQVENGDLIADPGEVNRAMVECGAILQRIGGVMSVAALREEFPVHSGRLVTTKILVKWQSFVPRMTGVVVPDTPPPAPEPAEAAAAGENGSAPTG